MPRYSKRFVNSVLLLMIPSLALYPQADISITSIQTHETSQKPLQIDSLLSYDDVLNLINDLETGELEKRCSQIDLERINHFLVNLAVQGILPNEVEEEFVLQNDIHELLHGEDNPYEYSFSLSQRNDYVLVPSIFYGQERIIPCKGWFSKKIDQTVRFAKKHKKAIIIGTAIVVGVGVVIGVAAAVSSAAPVAAGVVTAGSDKGKKDKSNPKEEQSSVPASTPSASSSSTMDIASEAPTLKAAMDEHISSFKEMVVEEDLLKANPMEISKELSFIEKVRDLGAFLAHETLDGISQLGSFVPQLSEEIKDIGERLIPNGLGVQPNNEYFSPSPKENYETLMTTGHRRIDQAFSTDQSVRYTSKAKANSLVDNSHIGILPPPGILSTNSIATGRLAATEVSAIKGWKVGQPINNRTAFGTIPQWSTVRRRYWKNQAEWAKSNNHDYGDINISRMEKGLAPQRVNPKTGQIESMELHHTPPQKEGGLFNFVEVWPEDHAKLDPQRYIGQ